MTQRGRAVSTVTAAAIVAAEHIAVIAPPGLSHAGPACGLHALTADPYSIIYFSELQWPHQVDSWRHPRFGLRLGGLALFFIGHGRPGHASLDIAQLVIRQTSLSTTHTHEPVTCTHALMSTTHYAIAHGGPIIVTQASDTIRSSMFGEVIGGLPS